MSRVYNSGYSNGFNNNQLRILLRRKNYLFNFTIISNMYMAIYFLSIGSLIVYALNQIIKQNHIVAKEILTIFVLISISYVITVIGFSILAIKIKNLDNRVRMANIGLLVLAISHQIQMLIMFGIHTLFILVILFISGLIVQLIQLYTLTIHPKTKSIFRKYSNLISNPLIESPMVLTEISLVVSPSQYTDIWL